MYSQILVVLVYGFTKREGKNCLKIMLNYSPPPNTVDLDKNLKFLKLKKENSKFK